MWLIFSIFAYFLNAISAIIDKALLGKSIPRPKVYAFFIGLLGLLSFVLAPFGFSFISFKLMMISLIAGILFIIALLFFFSALKIGQASRVVILTGAIQPLGIFFLSFFFLGERLLENQILAFILLIMGTVLISFKKEEKKDSKKWIFLSLMAGLIFALFYILTKYLFTQTSFINGFLWPRIGSLLAIIFLFFNKTTRQDIFSTQSGKKGKTYFLFLGGQASGALSALLIHYAIFLGSVTLVNALQGAQYVFVLIMAIFLSFQYPLLFKEKKTPLVILQKISAVLFIAFGIFLLAFS